MPSITANPLAFFEKTAHYASQGRGVFTLSRQPTILATATERNIIANGWNLLSSGLVAKSINMPGSNLATFEEFSFNGPTRKHAYGQLFGPLTVEFLLMGSTEDEARAVFRTFELWHKGIAGPVDGRRASDAAYFPVAYYNDYTTDAEVKIYSPMADLTTDAPIFHSKYYEIYPQAVGGLTTAWDSQDAPLTLSVTFEFFYTESMR